mgnify:FL=1
MRRNQVLSGEVYLYKPLEGMSLGISYMICP